MATQQTLLEMPEANSASTSPTLPRRARLKEPCRDQLVFSAVDLEMLIPQEHLARAIWDLVQQLPTVEFLKDNKSVEGHAGRPRISPRMLLALWIYGYSQGLGEARAIAEQMRYEPALRWLAGNSMVSARTLSEFRIAHGEALRRVFTSLLGILEQAHLVDLSQVTLDGTKIAAQARASSFRREPTLREHIEKAEAWIRQLEDPQQAEQIAARNKAARLRAAQDRQQRLQAGLAELDEIRKAKTGSKREQARVSETEPEARVMKDGNGGYGPSYNVQSVIETKNKIIVNIEATQAASDQQQLKPALDRLEKQLGSIPQQVIVDGGYSTFDNIHLAHQQKVELIGPTPMEREQQKARNLENNLKSAGIDPEFAPSAFHILPDAQALRCPQGQELKRLRQNTKYVQYMADAQHCAACPERPRCCPKSGRRSVKIRQVDPVVEEYVNRVQEPATKQIYQKRGPVAEFPHAWIKDKLGLRKFHLQGRIKANLEAMWAALTYNVQQWFRLLWMVQRATA